MQTEKLTDLEDATLTFLAAVRSRGDSVLKGNPFGARIDIVLGADSRAYPEIEADIRKLRDEIQNALNMATKRVFPEGTKVSA